MRKFLVGLTAVVLTVVLSLPAEAGVKSVAVKVDGLACPFCAYGVEKKLKKVEGVENLKIDIDAGKVTLNVKPDVRLAAASDKQGLVAGVKKAVIEGGFTPRELGATVEGNVLSQEGGWRLRLPETGELLALKENGRAGELNALAGKRASVTGVLEGEGAALALAVERIAGVSAAAAERYRLKISGMVCTGCASAIQAALERVEGVQAAEVDLEKGLAIVTTAPGKVRSEQLVAAVNGMSMEGMPEGTFEASVVKE